MPFVRNAIREECHFPDIALFRHRPRGDVLDVRVDVIHAASQTELAAATAYEATKFADRDTGQRCRDHGVRLVPMVAESLGGWGIEAQKAFKVIGRSLSATTGTPHGTVVAQLYEKLSVMIMRAAARSSLARAADAAAAPFCPAQARALAELEATDA